VETRRVSGVEERDVVEKQWARPRECWVRLLLLRRISPSFALFAPTSPLPGDGVMCLSLVGAWTFFLVVPRLHENVFTR
jgi:hypothetical protein